jgi:hypothetical protein
MSEFFFGVGSGHLGKRAARIAAKHGVDLVNYTDPRGERRHWFATENRGSPFDDAIAAAVMAELNCEVDEK